MAQHPWVAQLGVRPPNLPDDSQAPAPLLDPAHRSFRHPYHRQIQLDIPRAFHFHRCSSWSEEHRDRRVSQLGRVLHRAFQGFAPSETVNYYQGLHDVASVLLLRLGPVLAVPALQRVLRSHLRGFVHSDMQITICVLQFLFPLVAVADGELHAFLTASKVQPFFALSWVLTWFGHAIHDLDTVSRLFDLFLPCHPLLPLYCCAAVLMHRRKEVLQLPCDATDVHQCLQTMPEPFPDDVLREHTLDLFHACPPCTLLETPDVDAKTRMLLHSQWPQLWTDSLYVVPRRRRRRLARCLCRSLGALWWGAWGLAALAVAAVLVWFWVTTLATGLLPATHVEL